MVESRLPKPLVAGSIPVSRSTNVSARFGWLILAPLIGLGVSPVQAQPPDFAFDVLPIFEASCLHCHGPRRCISWESTMPDSRIASKEGISGLPTWPGTS